MYNIDAAKPSYQEEHGRKHKTPWTDLFIDEVKRGLVACKVFVFFPIYWLVYSQMVNNLVSQGMLCPFPLPPFPPSPFFFFFLSKSKLKPSLPLSLISLFRSLSTALILFFSSPFFSFFFLFFPPKKRK